MSTTTAQKLRESVSKTGPWNYAWSELRLQAAMELEALQNRTTELKAFCDDVEGLLQAERNQNQGLRDQLKEASVLIEKIGTTGVERTDIILKAEQWLKDQP